MESAQLRASSAFVPYVIHVPTCFMCLRALCALLVYMPSCLCIIRALIFSRAWHAILFYVLYIPSIFYVPHVSAFFYLFYLPSFFTWLHFFKFFEFLTCLMCLHFFIKCGTIHNYPQQAATSIFNQIFVWIFFCFTLLWKSLTFPEFLAPDNVSVFQKLRYSLQH